MPNVRDLNRHVEFVGSPGVGKTTACDLILPSGALSRQVLASHSPLKTPLLSAKIFFGLLPHVPITKLHKDGARRFGKLWWLACRIANAKRCGYDLYLDQGVIQSVISLEQFWGVPLEASEHLIKFLGRFNLLPKNLIVLVAPVDILQSRIRKRGTVTKRLAYLSVQEQATCLSNGQEITNRIATLMRLEHHCNVYEFDATQSVSHLVDQIKGRIAP